MRFLSRSMTVGIGTNSYGNIIKQALFSYTHYINILDSLHNGSCQGYFVGNYGKLFLFLQSEKDQISDHIKRLP